MDGNNKHGTAIKIYDLYAGARCFGAKPSFA